MSYDAFLSFSTHPDYKLSQKVESFLEDFHRLKTPKEIQLSKLEICRDGSDFFVGQFSKNITSENKGEAIKAMLESYLRQSDYLIVLCSSQISNSQYVQFEIEWFLANKGPDKILLAITEASSPFREPEKIFPSIVLENRLNEKPYFDFRGFRKKEAKEWERVRDFEEELTNLAALLNGDTSSQLMPLWHRERLKKIRRQRFFISITALILFFVANIAVWNFIKAENNSILAEKRTREVLSNEIVYKLDTIPDKTTAFRLLEYALKLNNKNYLAIQKLIDLYYFNNDPFYSAKIRHPEEFIRKIAFSNDGNLLATASFDKMVKIWDTHTSKELFSLGPHPDEVWEVAFSPDDETIATATGNLWGFKDMTIRLWDTDTGELLDSLVGHRQGIRSIDFSYDGTKLASSSADGEVRIWDLSTKMKMIPPIEHNGPVRHVKFSHDGKKVVTVTEIENEINIWDISTKTATLLQSNEYSNYLFRAYFTKNDKNILTSSFDGNVTLLDVNLKDTVFSFQAHSKLTISAQFSPDEKRIFTASYDNTLKIWDVSTKKRIGILYAADTPQSSIYSAKVNKLATAVDNRIKVWDLNAYPSNLILTADSLNTISHISLSSNNRMLSASISNDSLLFWDISKELRDFGNNTGVKIIPITKRKNREYKGGKGYYIEYSFWYTPNEMSQSSGKRINKNYITNHPKENIFFSSSNIGFVDVWKNKKKIRTIETGQQAHAFEPSCSHDGRILAVPARDSTVAIINLATSKHHKLVFEAIPQHVAFSPSGNEIAVSTSNGYLEVWDPKKHKKNYALKVNDKALIQSDFSNDGSKILTVAQGNIATVWDVKKQQELFSLKGHWQDITGAWFSYSNNFIITTSLDKTVKIWDSTSGRLLLNFNHENTAWASILDKNEDLLFNLVDRQVFIFYLNPDSILAEANNRFAIAHLAPEFIRRYDLEKSFDLAGYSIPELVNERDEEKMLNIADYYVLRYEETDHLDKQRAYLNSAIQLYEVLEKGTTIYSPSIFKEKIDSLMSKL